MKNLIAGIILGAAATLALGAAVSHGPYQITAVYVPDTARIAIFRVNTQTGVIEACQRISSYSAGPMQQTEPMLSR
jgi:hypothetical protein